MAGSLFPRLAMIEILDCAFGEDGDYIGFAHCLLEAQNLVQCWFSRYWMINLWDEHMGEVGERCIVTAFVVVSL